MSHSQKESVVFDRRTGPPLSIASGSTDWVSVLETINAVGASISPLVIHRGKNPREPRDIWFPPAENTPNWFWGFTEKGWTSNDYALEWLSNIFIPETRHGRTATDHSYWRLLIIDGHGSHCTGAFIAECLLNQISILYLLPHTSHLCQPCDLGPFSQLKAYYAKNLKRYILPGQTQVSRAEFDILYHQARQSGLTEQYIIAGWRRSGLYPPRPEKVLEKPEIQRYRQVTPDLLPPQSIEAYTPQDLYQFNIISERIAGQLSRSGRRDLNALNHAYHRESTARKILSYEVQLARKRTLVDEEQITTKRLKKQDEKRIWSTQEVLRARGMNIEESELLLSILPDRDLIYRMADEPDI